MAKQYDIMVAGHLCLDVIPRFIDTGITQISEIMRPGKLVNVEEVCVNTGGPVSNTGISMRTLGNNVCFCARVGDDLFGKLTIDILHSSGNSDGIHIAKGTASSYTIVLAPPKIDRIFLHNPGSNNKFGSDDLNPALIAECRHFHFGYPPLMRRMYGNGGAELQKVFQTAKQAGVTTSCDMTLPDPESESGKAPWRSILKKILPYIDLLVPSIEESFYMLEPEKFIQMKKSHGNSELIDYFTPSDYSRIADEMLSMGARVIALKSGQRGFYVKTADKSKVAPLKPNSSLDVANWSDRELWAPAYKVPVLASAAGSGDCSIAGFLSGYLRGLNIEDSLKYAVCCGWQNVQALDAVSGIKTWDETTQLIAENMPMIDSHITDKNWKWSDKFNMWLGPKDILSVA